MPNIDPSTPLFQLTVEQFLSLTQINQEKLTAKKYEYGIKGIQKIFRCSKSKAFSLKKSGILNEAITQNGKYIVIDAEKAIELFNKSNIFFLKFGGVSRLLTLALATYSPYVLARLPLLPPYSV